MTLEQLRIFIAVAEREHMTAAARSLNVTQSAVSAGIATLEAQHDIKLFDRIGRGIRLTELGRTFLIEARAVLGRAASAELVLEEFGELKRGSLRLVASQTIAGYWLPTVLAEYRRRYPGITIELTVGNTEQAASRVHDGDADLGMVEGAVDDPALAHWPLGEDRLIVVQSSPFAGGEVDPAWLRSARWVMRERGSGTRSTFDAAMLRIGIEPETLDVALVLPSNEGVRTAVEAGAGVAALSALVIGPAILAGGLHALPLDLGIRPFFGLRHKERYSSAAADALLHILKEMPSSANTSVPDRRQH